MTTSVPDKIKWVDIFLAEFSAEKLIARLKEKYGEAPEPVTTFYKKGKLVLAEAAYATRQEYITHSDLESFYKKHDPKKVSRVDDQLSHSNPKALIRRLVRLLLPRAVWSLPARRGADKLSCRVVSGGRGRASGRGDPL